MQDYFEEVRACFSPGFVYSREHNWGLRFDLGRQPSSAPAGVSRADFGRILNMAHPDFRARSVMAAPDCPAHQIRAAGKRGYNRDKAKWRIWLRPFYDSLLGVLSYRQREAVDRWLSRLLNRNR